jgi:hypothetical protein
VSLIDHPPKFSFSLCVHDCPMPGPIPSEQAPPGHDRAMSDHRRDSHQDHHPPHREPHAVEPHGWGLKRAGVSVPVIDDSYAGRNSFSECHGLSSTRARGRTARVRSTEPRGTQPRPPAGASLAFGELLSTNYRRDFTGFGRPGDAGVYRRVYPTGHGCTWRR